MNGRVARIIRRRVSEMVVAGKMQKAHSRRARRMLKLQYHKLSAEGRDDFALRFTPLHVILRRAKRRGSNV